MNIIKYLHQKILTSSACTFSMYISKEEVKIIKRYSSLWEFFSKNSEDTYIVNAEGLRQKFCNH